MPGQDEKNVVELELRTTILSQRQVAVVGWVEGAAQDA
jgi:hypothetical protein